MSLESGSIEIRPLDDVHDRAAFSCGVGALDDYLKKRASRDRRANAAGVFVARVVDASTVLGYYTLSAFSIILGDLPDVVSRRLPKYPKVPAALIGRLAVATDVQGQGLGAALLVDAMKRVIGVSGDLAVAVIVVDAKDEAAACFYERHGFLRFPSEPSRLFIPNATVRKLYP